MDQLVEDTKPNSLFTCVIPARGGSKRVKNKNKRLFNGIPLFDYALRAAINSKIFTMIIVSSNDRDILAHTYSYFSTQIVQPHKRPSVLCADNIPLKVAVRYCLQAYKAEELTYLLQPTNPFVTSKQIVEARDVFKKKDPNYLIGMNKGKDIGFHIFKKSWFLKEYDKDFYGTNWIPYEMDGIDIDTEEEWEEAERLFRER
tara:strand:- start:14424 stop:15026 length:603 start_codon:yes stop_codon:yes gene_type:complete